MVIIVFYIIIVVGVIHKTCRLCTRSVSKQAVPRVQKKFLRHMVTLGGRCQRYLSVSIESVSTTVQQGDPKQILCLHEVC